MAALQTAFKIIETVVSNQAGGMTFAEIVAATATPKASAHRNLKELVDLDLLTFTPDTARYRGSLRLAALGGEITANFDLRTLVHPHLQKLHNETHHTANLAIRDGDAGVYLDKIETREYGIRLFSEVGKRFPLHCTALGKALLTFLSGKERRRILKGHLPAFTLSTITDSRVLTAELAEIRELGYALDREEITRGVMCVAAPIFGSPDDLVGAVSIAFPSYVHSDRGIEAEIEAVRRHASAISGVLEQG